MYTLRDYLRESLKFAFVGGFAFASPLNFGYLEEIGEFNIGLPGEILCPSRFVLGFAPWFGIIGPVATDS